MNDPPADRQKTAREFRLSNDSTYGTRTKRELLQLTKSIARRLGCRSIYSARSNSHVPEQTAESEKKMDFRNLRNAPCVGTDGADVAVNIDKPVSCPLIVFSADLISHLHNKVMKLL